MWSGGSRTASGWRNNLATVYRPRITRWLLGKKRVNSKTPGAIKKRSTSKIWWYRYTDANGVQQQERGCKDRSATMALAVAAERAAEKNEAPPMTVGQAIVAFQASSLRTRREVRRGRRSSH